MKVYELMVIINGSLDEDAAQKAVEEVEKTIKAKKGTVTALDEWGKRKLAYQINKQDFGYYNVWRFTSEKASAPADIQNTLKINDSVLRSMVTIAPKKKGITTKSDEQDKPQHAPKASKATAEAQA